MDQGSIATKPFFDKFNSRKRPKLYRDRSHLTSNIFLLLEHFIIWGPLFRLLSNIEETQKLELPFVWLLLFKIYFPVRKNIIY